MGISSKKYISCIRERFAQPGYQLYRRLQDVILKSLREDITATDDLDYVLDTYNTELDRSSLIAQLQILKTVVMERDLSLVSFSLKQIINLLKDLDPATKSKMWPSRKSRSISACIFLLV